jgi:UDP-N-acetylglucosamine 4,6-dehydratase
MVGQNSPFTATDFLFSKESIFVNDIKTHQDQIDSIVKLSSFLVVGAAGTIGSAVVRELFKRQPLKLHVLDISENNLVELVRDLRSSFGYIGGEFKAFCLDIGSIEYDAFIESDGGYDYVFNLSALKHVRSEKDPFTLMRMIDVNITNTNKTIHQSIEHQSKKYFCVSTDKAANPINMMGASKSIMEMFLMKASNNIPISTARFANVAFSDGSLLHGFIQRFNKQQPLSAPSDISRYFLTHQESGELCLLSCILGENKDIFFPKILDHLPLISFTEFATSFLKSKGYEPYLCQDENEARELSKSIQKNGKWPCFFSSSDTTGEKNIEEFYTENEITNLNKYKSIGVIKNNSKFNIDKLNDFENQILSLKNSGLWDKEQIVSIFHEVLTNFDYEDKGKYLDGKM